MNYEDIVLEECEEKENIFIYISKNDEVDTRRIIKKLLARSKNIIVPTTQNNNIIPVKFENFNTLKISSYKILEPTNAKNFDKKKIDIFFVPGRKFDKKGNRKGRGKGYFDRFLADIKGVKPIIGLCFEEQVVNKLVTKPWDIPVDRLIIQRKIDKENTE